MRRLLIVSAFAVVPALLAAQTPADTSAAAVAAAAAAQVAAAAETITAQEIATHTQVVADDSMKGRDTPSRGLEATARYVAAQFKALGLRTAAGNGTWFQRYQIPPQMDFTRSQVVFTGADGKRAVAGFTTGVRLANRAVPDQGMSASAILLAGPQTPQSLGQFNLNNKVVVYVAPKNANPATEKDLLDQLQQWSRGVVIVSDLDSADFADRVQYSLGQPDVRLGMSWRAQVRPGSVPGLPEMLTASGVDLKQARAATKPVAQDLPSLQVAFTPLFVRSPNDSVTAPNVIGAIEGSDPKLKEEYIVFVAHMDHTGVRRGQTDSIANGADDNASGTAGLLALAKAFSQPGARPARSVVFIATSGGAKNFWGAREFVGQLDMNSSLASLFGGFGVVMGGGPNQVINLGGGGGGGGGVIRYSLNDPPDPPTPTPNTGGDSSVAVFDGSGPATPVAPAPTTPDPAPAIMPMPTPMPGNQIISAMGDPAAGNGPSDAQTIGDLSIGRVVVAVNLDMIGRRAGDSVVIDGLSEVEVPTPAAWLAAAHPELKLSVVDGGTAANEESDHFAFVRQAIPSLYFHNGSHGVATAESVKSVDPDLTARIIRLAFFLGQDIANGKRPPQWNAEGRRHYLEILDQ